MRARCSNAGQGGGAQRARQVVMGLDEHLLEGYQPAPRSPPSGGEAACPRSGPGEGSWGNREVSPAPITSDGGPSLSLHQRLTGRRTSGGRTTRSS
jgi:hypothetical protein